MPRRHGPTLLEAEAFVESVLHHTRDPDRPEEVRRCALVSRILEEELQRAFLKVDADAAQMGGGIGVTGDVFRSAAYAAGVRLARAGEEGWRVYSARSWGQVGRKYSFYLTAEVPGRRMLAGVLLTVRRLRRRWLGYATEWRRGPRAVTSMRDGYRESLDEANQRFCEAIGASPPAAPPPPPAGDAAEDIEEMVT